VSVLTEGFQKGVGGIVVTLTGLITDGAEGTGHDEEIQLVPQEAMKIPRSIDFGSHHRSPSFVRHVDYGCITKLHG
jgi:hypothetical protein